MGTNRGGHDPKKVYAAFKQDEKGKPTVILAQTIKGYGMGERAEGKNIAHQVKKMNMDGVHFRDQLMMLLLMSKLKNYHTLRLKKIPKSTNICMSAVKR
ncbi:hypothetical protein [Providencia hangzhouensis]|uniref:hypothetical protein n=1 Tax=Providencia hangzhouensis TaxID=3031799 RepID=UPI0034DD5CD9